MNASSGVFLTIEGIDGCGKTTQTQLLFSWLSKQLGEENIVRTFEPGGWSGGVLLRELLLGGISLNSKTELLLFLADRSGHIDSLIYPSLQKGQWVLCERYTDSTLAYQSWGRGIELNEIKKLLDWCRFPEPTLTVLLDVDAEIALARTNKRGQFDRIEAEGLTLMRRVAQGYRELASLHPKRYLVIDANQEADVVARLLREGLQNHSLGRERL